MIKRILLSLLLFAFPVFAQFQSPAIADRPGLGDVINWSHPHAPPSLVGTWVLVSNYGTTITDYTSNAPNGIFSNMTEANWILGEPGEVLDFTLSNDFVSMPAAYSHITGDFTTVICRIRIEAYDGSGFIVFGTDNGAGSNSYWQFNDTQTEVFVMGNGMTIPLLSLNDGEWHHLAFVARGAAGGTEFYYNGELWATDVTNVPVALVSGAKDFGLGDWVASPGNNWAVDGQIEYLYFYNDDLSAGEIKDIYENPYAMFKQDEVYVFGTPAAAPTAVERRRVIITND